MEEIKQEEMQTKPNSRQRLIDRYRASKPDVNWEEEQDVEGMAADELEELYADREANKAANDKMNELFGSNKDAARLFLDWSNGQDPVEKFIEYFGEDFTNALQDEAGKEKFKEALEKWRAGKKADEEHRKAYDENIEKTARELVAFADEKGLNDDEVKDIVEKAHEFGSNVCDGYYPKELLELIYKAEKYDSDIEDAREEGRVEGKSENIRRELRQSKPATGLPPTIGGQDAINTESLQKPKRGKLDMFGGIEAKRK